MFMRLYNFRFLAAALLFLGLAVSEWFGETNEHSSSMIFWGSASLYLLFLWVIDHLKRSSERKGRPKSYSQTVVWGSVALLVTLIGLALCCFYLDDMQGVKSSVGGLILVAALFIERMGKQTPRVE